ARRRVGAVDADDRLHPQPDDAAEADRRRRRQHGDRKAEMRILVVEDHPTLRRTLGEGLREERYAVDTAASGDEAAHLLNGAAYDCVVLDVMLPGRSGFDVLADMRRVGNHSPVLCLTAKDSLEDRVRGLDLGADDYLVKPFEWDELLARVRALV